MRNLWGAVTLLTRVPVPGRPPATLGASVPWLPVVGAVVGLCVAGAYAGLMTVLPLLPAAAVAVGLGVAVTGAFHEDGLADTADAFAGSWDRDEALRIMHDPHHGTFGILALVWSLLVRVACVATFGPAGAVAALVGAHTLGRGAAVAVMGTVRPATSDGAAATVASGMSRGHVVGGVATALVAGAVALGPWILAAAPLAAVGAAGMGWHSVRKIGGITGDVLGAVEQIAEILVLVAAAMVAASGAEVAWWR